MENIVSGAGISLILTIIFLPIVIKLAELTKLFVPINYRRIHTSNVSALGGIVIFASVIISFLFFSEEVFFPKSRFVIISVLIMFIIGLHDDLYNVKPYYKLLGQFLASTILVLFAGLEINFNAITQLHNFGPWINIALTVILIVIIINSYNLIDGIDLLASLLGMLILSVLGIWFYAMGQLDFSLVLFSISASLVGFMIFNFSPSKIFMGDTGTMTIGLIIAMALIRMNELNINAIPAIQIQHPKAFSFSLISLIVFDLLRVATVRIMRGGSPLLADKNHIHHLFLRLGYNQNTAALIIFCIVLMQVVFTFWADRVIKSSVLIVGCNLAFLVLIYAFIIVLLGNKRFNKQ